MTEAAVLLGRAGSLGLLVVFAGVSAMVEWRQNRSGAIGGRISTVKILWLAYVVTLWIALPLILAGEGIAFALLAVSMVGRAVVEVPLCLVNRWRAVYGVGHDVFHLLLIAFVWFFLPCEGFAPWAVLTGVSLLCELIFVRWFVRATGGPKENVFFIPAGLEFRAINRRTAVLLIPQLFFFMSLLLINLV